MDSSERGDAVPALVRRHMAWFEAYVAGFRAQVDGTDAYCIDLKHDHSLRVFDEARAIIATLDLPEPLVLAGSLAALYHDVGRFRQYLRYRTFADGRSENHGRLGARVLFEEKVLAELPADLARLIFGAVAMHNRARAPKRSRPELDLLTRLVRDGDKLDIYRVMIAHFRGETPKNDVVALHLRDEPDGWSPALVQALREERLASYADMRVENDFKLLLLSWVYDLNFPASYETLLGLGRLDELGALLPRDDVMRDVVDKAVAHARRRAA